MKRKHNVKNVTSLLDVLPKLDGIKADLTVKVSLETLGKLPPDKCKAFLEGIAAVVAANAVAGKGGDDDGRATIAQGNCGN